MLGYSVQFYMLIFSIKVQAQRLENNSIECYTQKKDSDDYVF